MTNADTKQIIISGSAARPKFIISHNPKRMPKQIIPSRRIFLILKSIPNLKFSEILNILLTTNPMITASKIDEIGLLSKPMISVPK